MTGPHLDVDLPEAPWVAVPVDADPDWPRLSAEQLCAGGPGAEPLAEELAVVARRAGQPGVLSCAVVVPQEAEPRVVAVLVVEHVACQDVDEVLEALAETDPTALLGEPQLSRVRLPLGAAVRAHVLTTGTGGTGEVVEHVEHVVPLGDGTGVRASVSWTSLTLGDELVRLADDVAAGLQVTER